MSSISGEMIEAARTLGDSVNALKFSPPVSHVYNPLDYAWASHEQYLKKFAATPKRIVFLGMNPGPFGMAQTGVPFGEVNAVRDWLGVRADVRKPARGHAKRPVLGFDCPRCEVSGQRLWGLFAQRFGTADKFFREHFVVNYCPLAFLAESGANLTPDKLPRREAEELFAACDQHLARVVELLQPEWLVGVGRFAFKRLQEIGNGRAALLRRRGEPTGSPYRVTQILHPSPASPAANRDWAGTATRQLQACGAWAAASPKQS